MFQRTNVVKDLPPMFLSFLVKGLVRSDPQRFAVFPTNDYLSIAVCSKHLPSPSRAGQMFPNRSQSVCLNRPSFSLQVQPAVPEDSLFLPGFSRREAVDSRTPSSDRPSSDNAARLNETFVRQQLFGFLTAKSLIKKLFMKRDGGENPRNFNSHDASCQPPLVSKCVTVHYSPFH